MAGHRGQVVAILAWSLLCGQAGLTPWAQSQAATQSQRATQSQSGTQSQKTAAKKKTKATTTHKKPTRSSPRLRRMRQAFVASTTLRPMAGQLLQDRTPAAYAGVQGFALRHAKEDAGSLAWLVVGYAHILDHDYARAIEPLNRARPQAGDLGDYVSFYLGSAYQQTGHLAEAIATFSVFEKTYPESLLIRDARVVYANALVADGRATEAATLLEADRQPIRADLELALGRAYEAAGQPAKALTIFRNLFYTMPTSWEAGQVQADLTRLAALTQAAPVGPEARRTRADLLMKGKQFTDAANEYRILMGEVTPPERPAVEITLAEALRRAGQSRDARKILELVPTSPPELDAQRIFNLGELARSTNDDDTFLRGVDQLRQLAPTSTWLEQALFSAGNIYLLRRDFDRAIDSFRELQQRFPNGSRASYAHWKAAWLSLRQGRMAEAKTDFDNQIALYPTSSEVPAALYWRARLAEEDNDGPLARAFYLKLSQRYRNYYYGDLARQRLAKLKSDEPPVHFALLDRVPPLSSSEKLSSGEVPDDNLRVQKAELLANGGLLDFAVRELRAAAEQDKGNWLAVEIARLYTDAGRYDAAIETLKHAAPNYFALDLPSLPRSYWEGLFPKPFWGDLKKYSSSNALDPYLVASLIRQESAFNPNAVSRANAVGLMQLLPKVGKNVAKQEKLKKFSSQQLFTPAVNMQLGTRYFRTMVDKFESFEYALAAYNAGSDRVQDWMAQGKYRDPQEFVESIPFTETREYVQNIIRNANVYRQLYGAP